MDFELLNHCLCKRTLILNIFSQEMKNFTICSIVIFVSKFIEKCLSYRILDNISNVIFGNLKLTDFKRNFCLLFFNDISNYLLCLFLEFL